MASRYSIYPQSVRLKRLLKKLLLPKNCRHQVKYYPYLTIEKRSLFWKGRFTFDLQDWASFPKSKNKMMVIGSGPSVDVQLDAVTRLHDSQFSFVLLNGAASLVGAKVIREPYCVVIEDARFVAERLELLRALRANSRIVLSYAALHALCYLDLELAKSFQIWLMDSVLYPFERGAIPLEALSQDLSFKVNLEKQVGLSLNLSKGHFGCGTVMYAGIQLAFHQNVEELYLVGFDLTNFDQPRFYETKTNAAWTGLANAYETRILPAMELVKEAADERGMKVFNCSHTSILPSEIFPFNDLLMG